MQFETILRFVRADNIPNGSIVNDIVQKFEWRKWQACNHLPPHLPFPSICGVNGFNYWRSTSMAAGVQTQNNSKEFNRNLKIAFRITYYSKENLTKSNPTVFPQAIYCLWSGFFLADARNGFANPRKSSVTHLWFWVEDDFTNTFLLGMEFSD